MTKNLVRDVPVVMQMESNESAAACLSMILGYHGRFEVLDKLRTACGVSRDGVKLEHLAKAAAGFGLDVEVRELGLEEVRTQVQYPCIVRWGHDRYVVLCGFKGRRAYLNDPARGATRVEASEFDRSYAGVALEMRPSDSFERGGKRVTTIGYLVERLKGSAKPLVFLALSTFVLTATGIIRSFSSTVFVDHVLSGDSPTWVVPIVAILGGLVATECVLNIAAAVYLNRVRGKFAVVSSSRFMWHLLHLPVDFFARRRVGDLQQRQDSNEVVSTTLFEYVAPAALNALLLFAYLAVMLAYSWKLTVIALLAGVLNIAVLAGVWKARMNVTRQNMRDKGMLQATAMTGIESIETLKASGAEEGYFERWAGYQALANNSATSFERTEYLLREIPVFVATFANLSILMCGTFLIIRGEFTAGMLMSFQSLFQLFVEPMNSLMFMGQDILEMRTSMERVQDVLDHPVDEGAGKAGEDPVSSKLTGDIELRHVTFGYAPFEKPLIKDFSLRCKPGSWVALVGTSGSGKSTIGKLISGLYAPWEGEILFDGEPIGEINRDRLRASLAVVDQDIVTFEDTVEANIRLWDRSIESYEVIMAARDADIHDVIASRELGYQERLFPGGANFSGGQLQRLEIARVLASDPTIIILDEATSALDAKTEGNVMRALRDREVTCIVVAHRLSTIRDCDEIIVLREGSVVERGTHQELIELDGFYAELVRSE